MHCMSAGCPGQPSIILGFSSNSCQEALPFLFSSFLRQVERSTILLQKLLLRHLNADWHLVSSYDARFCTDCVLVTCMILKHTWKSSSELSSRTIAFLPLPAGLADFFSAGDALVAFGAAVFAAAAFSTAALAAAGFAGDLRLVPVDAALSLAALGAEASVSAKCLLRFTGKVSSS